MVEYLPDHSTNIDQYTDTNCNGLHLLQYQDCRLQPSTCLRNTDMDEYTDNSRFVYR